MGKLHNNKIAIVTGGTRGIGRAVVLALAREGCHVAFTYAKSRPDADSLVAEVMKLGRAALPVPVDVRDFESSQQFVEGVKEEFGGSYWCNDKN